MARLVEGTASDATPLERALVALARKTYAEPARLTPADLDPVRRLAGDGALDYLLVIGAFHFINRIADLLHVDPEVLPEPLRRFDLLRRLTVRITSVLMAKMDLAVRGYPITYEEARERFARATELRVEDELAPLAARPKLIEALKLALEERNTRSSLDGETVSRVQLVVEAALPARVEQAEGYHERPRDPVEAFAFVGTRYAYRTTEEMIAALRRAGYDDLGLLDLAITVADANQWARMYRLAGLRPELFYVDALAAPAVA